MRSWFYVALVAITVSGIAPAQNVLTGNYDNARTNAALSETVLNPASVKTGNFGKLFSLAVDGQIYAQPLYLKNTAITGKGTHNVVFVATMHNSVYAFDADVPGTPLWTVNLGTPTPAANYSSDDLEYSDITPENGILGTPVIDAATSTIYVVASTFENGKYFYRLHALDTGSGAERFNGPAVIQPQVAGIGDGSVSAALPFDAAQHLQRPALLLSNGTVYVAFGSHGDAPPFHGWLISYNAHNLQSPTAVFNASPNGAGGSFWQSGRGPAADEAGNVYAVSSNGDTDESTAFSDNVLKFDPTTLAVTDWFAPFNFQVLNDSDDDLGACGAVLIEGTNYLVTGGKQGVFYLLDRTNFGHVGANDGQIVQSVDTGNFGIFNVALWNRPDGPLLYLHTANSPVTAWRLQGGKFSTTPVAQSLTGFNVPFQGMTVSADGVKPGTGVLWVSAPVSYPLPSHGVLHAYNAEDLSELWNSDASPGDAIGAWAKFANPTVADGKVFLPTAGNQLLVYGTGIGLSAGDAPVVTGIVNAASYANGPLAPGEIVALFGSNLGPADIVVGNFDTQGVLRGQLSTSQVLFNGVPGPLVYTSATAAAAIVPYEVAGSKTIDVQVVNNGVTSEKITMPASAATPGIFTADASGSGPGAILNADYSLNSPDHPAQAGGVVIVYATGGGPTNPPAGTGAITTAAAPLSSEVTVTAGGRPVTVLYAGNAGGEVAGAVQLNLQLPEGLSGTVPIIVTIGGQASQGTATVSIE